MNSSPVEVQSAHEPARPGGQEGQMSDKALRKDVEDELNFIPSIDPAHIGVAVSEGVVTLTGHVESYAQKLAAERTVQGIKGVRGVAEEIEVRYPNDKKRGDDQIAERALSIINWHAQLPADAIKVKVENGLVTLSGEVDWQYQRMAAEAAIDKLSGIIGVINDIRVKPKQVTRDVCDEAMRALNRNAEIDADHLMVVAHNDRVTLLGRVPTSHQREVAKRAIWSVPGVIAVEDRLEIG
jgi:osmotically-inducible protein OsmY